MAQPQRKPDLIGKLADRGEDVVGKISDFPSAQRVVDAAAGLKARADEIQRRLRGLDELEKRVAALEKKVDRLAKPAPKRSAAKRTTTPRAKKT
ncbi:MAG: hypothetical protein E6F97_05115 [Actinobacteria bacterium]|nr:MAG: hypothetical protein E6F97_05115 [Actinomycetota bacterium]